MTLLKNEVCPWGSYTILLTSDGFQVKRVEIGPAKRLSLQTHGQRTETWVVISGEGKVTLGKKEVAVGRGSVVQVGVGEAHRMHNTGAVPLVFIEVQMGDYLGEDDIVRLEDDFGRAPR